MKKIVLVLLYACGNAMAFTQPLSTPATDFTIEKSLGATAVKNQAMTGTCWCFGATSLVESQCLKNNARELDLSEMFTVRNIYKEKAMNYILRQGHAQFGEGGLGHDMIHAIATYGAIPNSVYNGLLPGQKMHNHQMMEPALQKYLDSILKVMPVPANWMEGYTKILNDNLGTPPAEFDYKGKKYTPQSFAKEVVKFNPDDYVNITSFTHEPYYKSFVIQVPDNFSNGSYYNLPLNEMLDVVKNSVQNGYSVLWDADVSNNGFRQNKGLALFVDGGTPVSKDAFSADITEQPWSAAKRQQLYENLTTQDDHLMHITGLEKSKGGKEFFIVKNSWGEIGPYKGYINVSEAYLAINTISLIVPRAAINKTLLNKLGIK